MQWNSFKKFVVYIYDIKQNNHSVILKDGDLWATGRTVAVVNLEISFKWKHSISPMSFGFISLLM